MRKGKRTHQGTGVNFYSRRVGTGEEGRAVRRKTLKAAENHASK